MLERLRILVPALWAGLLLAVAGLATPAPFATLERAQAGLVVAHVLQREATLSLLLALAVVLMERLTARRDDRSMRPTAPVLLALGALACTVVGYFGLQPMMAAAKAGQGTWGFGTLHAASSAFFALKLILVLALAWRQASPAPR